MQESWSDQLIQAIIMRSVGGAAGESTIEERWSDIIASRSGVRIRQLLGAIAGCLLSFFGLFLFGLPLTTSGAVASVADAVLVGCGAALAILLIASAVEVSMKHYPRRRRLTVAGIGSALVLAVIAMIALRAADGNWWHLLQIPAGLSIAGPAIAFTYNQLSDLLDPGGMESGFERRVAPLLDNWIEQNKKKVQVIERSLYPYRHTNQEDYLARRMASDDGDSNGVIEVPAQDDLTFADWLEEAARRGAGRRAWLPKGKPRYICPTTKVRVTRPTYDKMIRKAATVGYLITGGDGEASAWLVDPEEAHQDWVGRLEDEWGEDMIGGSNGKG